MITTPSMGLTRWDQPNDVFSYTQLSDNFNLIDLHDHTSTKGVQIPTNGLANLAVTTTKLANDAVTTAKVLNANVTDAKLASPNNGSWRTMWQVKHRMTSADVSGTLLIAADGNGFVSGNSTTTLLPIFPFAPTNYSVAGKTLQLRLTVGGMINATAPGNTVSFGLRPVTVAGGAGVIQYTAGAVVGGTELSFVTPAASSTPISSLTFAAPAQGMYCVGVNVSATPAGNSSSVWTMLVQYSHV